MLASRFSRATLRWGTPVRAHAIRCTACSWRGPSKRRALVVFGQARRPRLSRGHAGVSVEGRCANRHITLEHGRWAYLADGNVVCRDGNLALLATSVADRMVPEGQDFLPLSIDFVYRNAASGRIPQGIRRKEVVQSDREVLLSRLVDRSIRPMVLPGFYADTQIVLTLLSHDADADVAVNGINAASAAACISRLPMRSPVGAVRVGMDESGDLVANPPAHQLSSSPLDLLFAGTSDRVVMLEAEASEVSDAVFRDALAFATSHAADACALQRQLVDRVNDQREEKGGQGSPGSLHPLLQQLASEVESGAGGERTVLSSAAEQRAALRSRAAEVMTEPAQQVFRDASLSKGARGAAQGALLHLGTQRLRQAFDALSEAECKQAADEAMYQAVRGNLLGLPEQPDSCFRCDGRREDEVRAIEAEASVLATPHGSAYFARGDTATLCTATLGPRHDVLREHTFDGEQVSAFMLQYHFPPYSTNETGRIGPNRRMTGHGALAEKALARAMPDPVEFPYAVRVSAEVTGSDGSSSMSTVCGASLSLMDAGVPIAAPVAGISVGLVTDADPHSEADAEAAVVDRYRLLTDIRGLEDHFGDMDFKVAGSHRGITALQLDVKLPGVPVAIMQEAVDRAHTARMHVLDAMSTALPAPRPDVKFHAPRAFTADVPLEARGTVLGQGGAFLRDIEERTGARLRLEDNKIFAFVPPSGYAEAFTLVQRLTSKVEVGDVTSGRVVGVRDFGYMVEFGFNKEGLLHISELTHKRVENPLELLAAGDYIELKCIGKDHVGRHKMSRKALLPHPDEGGSGTDIGEVRRLPSATADDEGDEGASDSE